MGSKKYTWPEIAPFSWGCTVPSLCLTSTQRNYTGLSENRVPLYIDGLPSFTIFNWLFGKSSIGYLMLFGYYLPLTFGIHIDHWWLFGGLYPIFRHTHTKQRSAWQAGASSGSQARESDRQRRPLSQDASCARIPHLSRVQKILYGMCFLLVV